ncbi:hypothetical protein HaLaN_30035, partial [Haematococcus lacustris]
MAPGSGLFPADHLFCALMKAGNVQDAMVWARQPDATGASTAGLTPPQSPAVTSPCAEAAGGDPPAAPSPQFEVLVAYLLGEEVCGHAGIVHGGLTAAMMCDPRSERVATGALCDVGGGGLVVQCACGLLEITCCCIGCCMGTCCIATLVPPSS